MGMAKDGILLAIGGMLGAFAVAAMTDGGVKETVRDTAKACREFAAADRLIETLRREGEKALKACADETEREAVYETIRASVAKYKAEMQERGETLIAELRAKAAGARDGAPDSDAAEGHVENVRQTLARLGESLDETLRVLAPRTPAPES